MVAYVGIGISRFESDGTLKLKRGEDVDLLLYFRSKDGAFDFTGYTAEMMIKETSASAAAITLTTANSSLILGTDSDGSFLQVNITRTQTSALQFSKGVYEIDFIKDNKRKTLGFPRTDVIVLSDITTA